MWGQSTHADADITGGVVRYNFKKPVAQPEHLFDLEVGSVYRDGQTMASANFFWMEFQDELINSGAVDIFGEPVMGNADRTRHIGIELQGQIELAGGFAISGNTTLSYNRLVRYSVVDSTSNGLVYRNSFDGNPIAGAPDFLANLQLVRSRGEWRVSLDAKYVGNFYTDNTKNNLLKNDAYTVVNTMLSYRLTLGSGVFLTVRGEIRNLFDALYTMSGEGIEFFPAAERNYIFGTSIQF